jgi:hypothetical protein
MLSNQLGLNVADLANGKATPSWETIEGLRHSASRDADQRRCQMERTDVGRRLDLRNISIDFAAASAGLCGFTHLDSGRVCRLPHRHHGPCQLPDRPRQPAERAVGVLRG